MERSIGEQFWDYGCRIECIVADDNTCKGCHYAKAPHSGKKMCSKKYNYVGDCLAEKRSDKTNVIFVCRYVK